MIRLIDGPLAPLPCASETAYRKCEECFDEQTCGTRIVMRRVRDAMAEILDHTTLADVCAEVDSRLKAGATPRRTDVLYLTVRQLIFGLCRLTCHENFARNDAVCGIGFRGGRIGSRDCARRRNRERRGRIRCESRSASSHRLPRPQEAAAQNAKQSSTLVADLKQLVGSGAEFQTMNYSVYPNYRTQRDGGKPTISGYQANNTVEVRLDDVSAAGKVIDAATKSGANQIQGIHFSCAMSRSYEPMLWPKLPCRLAPTRRRLHPPWGSKSFDWYALKMENLLASFPYAPR